MCLTVSAISAKGTRRNDILMQRPTGPFPLGLKRDVHETSGPQNLRRLKLKTTRIIANVAPQNPNA
jgi:hypothetical protein